MAVIKSKEPFQDKNPQKKRISTDSSSVIRNANVQEGQTIVLKKAIQNSPTPKTSTPITETTPSAPIFDMEEELAKKRRQMEQTLRAEQDSLRQKAHKEGYDRGYEEGKTQFSTLSKQTLDAINSIIHERNKVLEQNESAILELALTIAKKITQTVVKDNPEVFHNIFQEALNKITDKSKVLVRVNPQDLKLTQHYTAALQEELKDFKNLEIVGDTDIERGGCVIETNLGYIDSSISTKFHIIESALKNAQQGRK